MDLTQGYFQAPLSESARIYTAFITFMGIFEYLRVPMGPKGSPAYFQSVIATVVLAGLIYIICELYMDDVMVFADEEDEFIRRLRLIFERFRKHKLTANPKKCWFGLPECEFVGRELSATGISMSKMKKDSVINFPLPRVGSELKKFLGLVNYFIDHFRDRALILKPLQDLVHDYLNVKHKKIVWTDTARAAFETIKDTTYPNLD
jgi:hypothetical protein